MFHGAIFLATGVATNVALQVARKISRVSPQSLQTAKQQTNALRVARKVEAFSTFRNFARQVAACDMSIAITCNAGCVKMSQSECVFCSREISIWRPEKELKQFPAGAKQFAKNYCERVDPRLCNLQCFSVVIVALQVARKIAPCKIAFKVMLPLGAKSVHSRLPYSATPRALYY